MDVIEFRLTERRERKRTKIPENGEVWRIIGEPSQPATRNTKKLRLLASLPPDGDPASVRYVHYLHRLLDADISCLEADNNDFLTRLRCASDKSDLVIFGEPQLSFLDRFVSGRPGRRALARVTSSILILSKPRYPIRRILLVLRVEPTDEAAVSWVNTLAQASDASITILPIVPSMPAMYAQSTTVQGGLDVLLSSNTPSGQHIRRLARQFHGLGIRSTLCLRQGEPYWQIRWEAEKQDYDLIVIGEEPYPRWQRWLLGELVSPLLGWAYLPVLVAKSVSAAKER